MKYYTFNEVREIAIKNHSKDNKVSVGIWAKLNGYLKIKKQIDKHRITLYIKPMITSFLIWMIVFFLCIEAIRNNAIQATKDELYRSKIDKLENEITRLSNIINTKL